MYSRIAGTFFLCASRGRNSRAASRLPSGIGIQAVSMRLTLSRRFLEFMLMKARIRAISSDLRLKFNPPLKKPIVFLCFSCNFCDITGHAVREAVTGETEGQSHAACSHLEIDAERKRRDSDQ